MTAAHSPARSPLDIKPGRTDRLRTLVESLKFLPYDSPPQREVGGEKASLFLSDFLCLRVRLPIDSHLAAQDGVDREAGLGGWARKLWACEWRLATVAYCVASSGISKSTSGAGSLF